MSFIVQCVSDSGHRWRFIYGNREEAEDAARRITACLTDVRAEIHEEKDKEHGKPTNDEPDPSTPTAETDDCERD